MSVAECIATVGGIGRLPFAPGTVATLAAVPAAYALRRVPAVPYACVCAALVLVGAWAAGAADRRWHTHDSGTIVIDEVAGYLVAAAGIDRGSLRALLGAAAIFRVLDIAKPPPIRWLERLPGGAGVMADDVAAGLIAACIMRVARR